MDISRRSFLKGIAALAASAAIPIPAFSKNRAPYVLETDVVSHIGPTGPDGFIGARAVKCIGKWDGIGYPVTTITNNFPGKENVLYDFDLANLNREVPDRFWADPANKIYPNVHTYVRCKRFGETVEQSISKLNYATGGQFLETYYSLMKKSA